MGREIRLVPKGWEHPRNEDGHFKALFDEDYQTAAKEWWDAAVAWHSGGPLQEYADEDTRATYPWYWDWTDSPPDQESYRPAFTEPADCFQIYETVSEGTPVSPVFETKEDLIEWMCHPIDRTQEYNRGEDWQCMQGRTRESAEAFAEAESACSFVMSPERGLEDGVAALAKRS